MATKSKFHTQDGIKTLGNAEIDGSLTVSGNFTVNGEQTIIDSTTQSVTDSMIELASGNTTSDTIDVGIYGNYNDGLSGEGDVSEYTGLFRDATDSTWKLYDGLEVEPTTTVNTSGSGFTLADLQVGDLTATTLTATNSITGSSITYPTTDGTNGQVITTNGSGTLSFGDIPAGYADSDVESYLSGGTGVTYSSGAISIGQAVATSDSPTFAGLTVTGEIAANGGIALGDSDKVTFGAGDDLQIYHDGSNSWLRDVSIGDLYLDTNGTKISLINDGSYDTGKMADFVKDGAVKLYYDNAQKLATTATGIDVTGTATMDGLTITAATPSIQMTDSDNNADAYIQATDGNIRFYADDSAEAADSIVTFNIDGGEKVRIDSSGNVSIGTTSPADTLHVKKSSTVVGEAILTVEGGASGYGTGISFQSVLNGGSLAEMARIVADGEASWNTTASTQDAGLRFYTTGDGTSAIRMRIDASGRVGINRTPAISNSQLEVGGADNVPLINVEASGATGGMGMCSTGLQLFHGSTSRMKINSGGQITAPYQPSFLAYHSASYTGSGGSVKATFASTRHNVGSHYNTSTSKFTAPVAGNYLFVCDLAMQSSVSALSYMGIGVRKNNTGDIYFGGWGHKADGQTNTTSAQYAKTSSQIIMYLAQGDYVEPYIELSGSHTVFAGSDGAYTRFCGQLLS